MCHDDCQKHFPGRRRYNGILFVANSRQNPKTIIFVLTFGFIVGFTGLRSLFFDLASKYQAQGKAKQKKRKIQRQEQTLTSSTTTVFRSNKVMHNLWVS